MTWQRWEGGLTAQKEHRQPHSFVEVDIDFSGPGDAAFRVPAYWDGDRGFRFRATFPSAGIWHWKTTCNDPSDAGLHGQTGEIRVKPYTGENRFYRHGDLRVSADRRFLIHADGTPFLWMGDTAWNVPWKSTWAEWQEYIDARASQRFTELHVVATGTVAPNSTRNPPAGQAPFLDDGTPNAPFWRALEDKIAYANDRGMIVLLAGVGSSPSGFGKQQRPAAFARYLAGRFAGHMVIFSPSMDQKFDEQNVEQAHHLRALTLHLVTQHPGTDYDAIKRYRDAPELDFCGLQSGHRNGKLQLTYQGAREWTLEMWHRSPVKPVINIEAMYDAYGHNNAPAWREQDVRKLGWIAWLSGSRGYTYGAGDIPPKVAVGHGAIWNLYADPQASDYWRKAILWPSAGQMTHLHDFFAGIEWWRLEPAPDLVQNQSDDQQRKMVASRTAVGDLLVAYLPDNPGITLSLGSTQARWTGQWFNPISGDYVPLAEPVPTLGTATFRRPSGWSDAVLLLKKPADFPAVSQPLKAARGD